MKRFSLSQSLTDFFASIKPRETVRSDALSSTSLVSTPMPVELAALAEKNAKTGLWDVSLRKASTVPESWPWPITIYDTKALASGCTPSQVVEIFDRTIREDRFASLTELPPEDLPVVRTAGNYRKHPEFRQLAAS